MTLAVQFALLLTVGLLKVRKPGAVMFVSVIVGLLHVPMFPPMGVVMIICGGITEGLTMAIFRGYKKDIAGIFAGSCTRKGKVASSSFEVYVPIVETATKGRVIADGSLGYLGKISEPIELIFEAGYLVEINGGEDALRLKKYMESFGDKEMSIFRQPFQTLQEHLYAIILCTECFIHLQRSILISREGLHMCLLYLSR